MLSKLSAMFGKETTPDDRNYLIVGLGNPGREYRDTRHNVGFMAVDRFCEMQGVRLGKVKFQAIIGETRIGVEKVILAKPQTFMNLSGNAVASVVRFYKIALENVLVVHDDLDLPFGTLRLRPGGGAGGQKGLQSTIDRLGTQQFPRMRIGIGRPSGQMDAAAYVLQKFGSADQEELDMILRRAAEAIEIFVREGLDSAMNRFNGAGENGT
ncbi:MAG: aminoacyl-tRNA hydrolase [Anaerolineaceae bacterium]|jgi:PTH1 family peptidyl-tRNA hydrolase|nr:aminoacyl-tRNA hydrolase [Anaerolineaceae bacterium]